MSGRFNPPGHGQRCPCPRRSPQQFRAAAFRIEPRSLTMQDDGSSEGGAPMKALMLLALAGLSTMAGAAKPATLTLACKGTMTDNTEADAKPMPISMGIVNFTVETIIGGFAPSPQHGAGCCHDASPEACDASKRRGAHVLCGPVSSLRKADAEIGRLARHQESNAMQHPLLPSRYCPRRARAPDGH